MADQSSSSEIKTNPAVDDSSLNNNKESAKIQNEVSGDESTDHKPEDAKKCLLILKDAYEEKNLKLVDEIIEDMVSKSLVTGLKKIHTASGYGFADLIEKYIKEDKIDPNSECSFNDLTSITPLHFCAGIGPDPITQERDKCIQILVDNGANVNHLTSRGGKKKVQIIIIASFNSKIITSRLALISQFKIINTIKLSVNLF